MSDLTAVPLEAQQVPAQLSSSWAYEARTLVSGLVYTAAVAAAGASAVILALIVGVVAAPVILAVVALAVLRHRRRVHGRAWGTSRAAAG